MERVADTVESSGLRDVGVDAPDVAREDVGGLVYAGGARTLYALARAGLLASFVCGPCRATTSLTAIGTCAGPDPKQTEKCPLPVVAVRFSEGSDRP